MKQKLGNIHNIFMINQNRVTDHKRLKGIKGRAEEGTSGGERDRILEGNKSNSIFIFTRDNNAVSHHVDGR